MNFCQKNFSLHIKSFFRHLKKRFFHIVIQIFEKTYFVFKIREMQKNFTNFILMVIMKINDIKKTFWAIKKASGTMEKKMPKTFADRMNGYAKEY